MKYNKSIVVGILIISVLALAVASQIPQTATVSLVEKHICSTIFYNEEESVYGNCFHYLNYTKCLNVAGSNTTCSLQQDVISFTCRTGEINILRNSTECRPVSYVITTERNSLIQKKEIDFSGWGVCVNSTENGCIAITCGTLKGGSARNGIFNGCDGGKSCKKFLFCQDGVKTLYKSSRDDFVREDPTYNLPELQLKEVGQ